MADPGPKAGRGPDLDPERARQALAHGLAAHPVFAAYEPRLERIQLFRGSALQVCYGKPDRPGGPEAWAFQDRVIQEYKRLSEEG